KQAHGPGTLELDEAVSLSSEVADDEIAGEIAEERVLEGDPIVVPEAACANCNQRRELTSLAKERQDLPFLIQDRVLRQPFAELGHFLAAARLVETERLECFHP